MSSDIGMEVEFGKCEEIYKARQFIKAERIELDTTTTIKKIDQSEVYKFLVTSVSDCSKHSQIKEKILK